MILVSISSLIYVFFILKKSAYLDLNISNEKIVKYYKQTLDTSIGYTSSHLQFAEEFMNQYSIYNSTFDEYTNLASINDKFIDSLRVFYNVSYVDVNNFESRMSEQLNKSILITDININNELVNVTRRPWYCPTFYATPFTNPKVVGLDICNVTTFSNLIQSLNNDNNKIVFDTRQGILRKGTFLDFAKKTRNGFILLTANIENIINVLIRDTEKVKLFANGEQFYSNTENVKYLSSITTEITVPSKDIILITIFFPEQDVPLTFFIYILLGVVFINILVIIIISSYEIQKNRYIVADKMLGYVNHEIRNPLNCIHGLIELSIIELNDEKGKDYIELKSNLGTALNACDMLTHIVNDILDIKRINDGKLIINKEDIDIDEFEKSLKKIITSKLNENPNITYIFNNVDNISIIYSDYHRLLQLLLNFLTNAIKFTDIGVVSVILEKLERPINGSDTIKISVTDTGRGIAVEDFTNIFKPFDQANITDSLRHGGVGLGLYLCKMIVEQLKGKIGFESELNKGSTFWIII